MPTALSEATVRGLASAYPWPVEDVVKIARRESGFNPRATNFVPPDRSYGLMQINMIDLPGYRLGAERRAKYNLPNNEALFDPATNMRVAYGIYQENGNKLTGSAAWGSVPGGASGYAGGGNPGTPVSGEEAAFLQRWDTNGDGRLSNPDRDRDAERQMNSAAHVAINDVIKEYWDDPENPKPGWYAAAMAAGHAADDDVTDHALEAWIFQNILSATAGIGLYYEGGSGSSAMVISTSPLTAIANLPGDIIDSVGNTFDFVPDWMDSLKTVLGAITSADFWKRVGLGALAFFIIVIAVLWFNRDKLVMVASKGMATTEKGSPSE